MDLRGKILKFLATGAYAGYSPIAPGTMGTLWGVVIVFFTAGVSIGVTALVLAAGLFISIFLCSRAQAVFGGKDPSFIVADEIYGFIVAFFLIPFSAFNVILVFLLFRIFDIVKPYPAGAIDEWLEGGSGIVLDDVAAGVYANITAHVIINIVG